MRALPRHDRGMRLFPSDNHRERCIINRMHHTSSPSGHLFCCMLPQHAGERRLLKSRRLRPRENAHGRTQAQAPPSADDCRMSPIPRPAGSLCRIAYAEGSLKPFWGKRRPALQNSGTPAAKNGLWRPQAAPRRNAGQGAETEKAPGRQGRGLSRIWGCGVSHAAGSVRLFHGREPNVPQRPEWPGTWSFSPQA